MERWIIADKTNKMYLRMPLKWTNAISRIVNAIPDLIDDANKFMTIGLKKTIKKIGDK